MNHLWIVTPDVGLVYPEYADSLFKLAFAIANQVVDIRRVSRKSPPVHSAMARNRLARDAIMSRDKPDVLWIDSDQRFEPEAVMGLLESPYEVVGCPYPRREINEEGVKISIERQRPYDAFAASYPVHFLSEPNPNEPYAEIDAMGFGLMLTRYTALERLSHEIRSYLDFPGRLRTWAMFNETVVYEDDEDYVHEANLWGEGMQPEDVSFQRKWRNTCGGKVYMYVGVGSPIDHVGRHIYRGSFEGLHTNYVVQELHKAQAQEQVEGTAKRYMREVGGAFAEGLQEGFASVEEQNGDKDD